MKKWPIWLLIVFIVAGYFVWKERRQQHAYETVQVGDSSEVILKLLGNPWRVYKEKGYLGKAIPTGIEEWCYPDPIVYEVEVLSFLVDKNNVVVKKDRWQSP